MIKCYEHNIYYSKDRWVSGVEHVHGAGVGGGQEGELGQPPVPAELQAARPASQPPHHLAVAVLHPAPCAASRLLTHSIMKIESLQSAHLVKLSHPQHLEVSQSCADLSFVVT